LLFYKAYFLINKKLSQTWKSVYNRSNKALQGQSFIEKIDKFVSLSFKKFTRINSWINVPLRTIAIAIALNQNPYSVQFVLKLRFFPPQHLQLWKKKIFLIFLPTNSFFFLRFLWKEYFIFTIFCLPYGPFVSKSWPMWHDDFFLLQKPTRFWQKGIEPSKRDGQIFFFSAHIFYFRA